MKRFREEHRIVDLTRTLRSRQGFHPSFFRELENRGVVPEASVLLKSIPDQGCLTGILISQDQILVEDEIETTQELGTLPTPETQVVITSWEATKLDDEWWRKERPRGTQPRPNDPITIGLKLLRTQRPEQPP